MQPVIQEEITGCGIASVANILGKSYQEAKTMANAIGIYASDKALWSDTQYVRQMLAAANVNTSDNELSFESWSTLPDLALLAIKPYQENGKNFWHWVVFKRTGNQAVVLDSAKDIASHIRTDFDAMQPKWFIAVSHA